MCKYQHTTNYLFSYKYQIEQAVYLQHFLTFKERFAN